MSFWTDGTRSYDTAGMVYESNFIECQMPSVMFANNYRRWLAVALIIMAFVLAAFAIYEVGPRLIIEDPPQPTRVTTYLKANQISNLKFPNLEFPIPSLLSFCSPARLLNPSSRA